MEKVRGIFTCIKNSTVSLISEQPSCDLSNQFYSYIDNHVGFIDREVFSAISCLMSSNNHPSANKAVHYPKQGVEVYKTNTYGNISTKDSFFNMFYEAVLPINNYSSGMLIILIQVLTGCLIVNITLLLANSNILLFQN